MTALPSTVEMFDLRMSDTARPLLEAVTRFIADEVEPLTAEFFRLGEGRAERWGYGAGQLELLESIKDKAKQEGLWNFFLPNAETGEGLSNLDYAYIAISINAWTEPGDSGAYGADAPTVLPGFPSRRLLIDRYAALTGADLTNLAYYRAFNSWKLACILQGVYVRYQTGQKSTEGVDVEAVFSSMNLAIEAALQQAADLS